MSSNWKSLRGSLHGSLHGNFVVYLWALLACLGWGLELGLHIFPLGHFPGGSDSKKSACNVVHLALIPGMGRSPGGRHGSPLQYSCLENPHGQRSVAGCSPWGRKESDTTEWLSTSTYSSLFMPNFLPNKSLPEKKVLLSFEIEYHFWYNGLEKGIPTISARAKNYLPNVYLPSSLHLCLSLFHSLTHTHTHTHTHSHIHRKEFQSRMHITIKNQS